MSMKQTYDPNQPLDDFEAKLQAAEAMVLHKTTAQVSHSGGKVATKVPGASFGKAVSSIAAPALMAGALLAAAKGAVPVAKLMATAAEAVSSFTPSTPVGQRTGSRVSTAFGRGTRRSAFRTISFNNNNQGQQQRVSVMAPSRRGSMFRRTPAELLKNSRKPLNVPLAFFAPADPETAAALRRRRRENEIAMANYGVTAPERLEEQAARMGLLQQQQQQRRALSAQMAYRLTLS